MTLLFAGLALFFSTHLLGLAPAFKARLRDQLGVGGYRGLYSLISLAGLVLIVIGYRSAETDLLYVPPSWAQHLTHSAMPLAFILVAGANMKSNLKRFIAHPMALGILIWAVVHLLANGELADVVLFGAFAAYALIDMFFIGSSPAPYRPQPPHKDLILVVAGIVAFAVVFLIHNHLVYIGGPNFG